MSTLQVKGDRNISKERKAGKNRVQINRC